VLLRLQRRDKALADQARRAASSVLLNLEEGNQRTGGDRDHLFRIAAGSLAELRAALRIAIVWRHVEEPVAALALLDRLGGLLYGLTRASRQSMAISPSSKSKLEPRADGST
jgi:four helix bundle protein